MSKLYNEVLKERFDGVMKEINIINQLLFGLRQFDCRCFWSEDDLFLDYITYNKEKDEFLLVLVDSTCSVQGKRSASSEMMENLIKEKIENLMQSFTLFTIDSGDLLSLQCIDRDENGDMRMFFEY